jgi:NADH-quinone oxidoreductase subunit L
MVTAGVYMIGRNAVLFSHAPMTLEVVAVIGCLTALMAGTIGLVQNDIKRVLAYSTVSQLGYMFLAMGVGAFGAGIFHLYTHAFFKALLFLGSGAVIHALAGEQDLRNMGGLRKELPITYWTFLIGALAIAGVPLLSGFFSKDEILFRTYASGHVVLWVVAVLTSLLTAIYMFRLVFLAFHGERKAGAQPAGHTVAHPEEEEPAAHAVAHDPHAAGHGGHVHLHDAPPSMATALIVLAVGSILAGYVGVPHVLGGSNRIEEFLEPAFTVEQLAPGGAEGMARGEHPAPAAEGAETGDVEHAPAAPASTELGLMAFSSAMAIIGIGIAIFFFLRHRDRAEQLRRQFSGPYRVLLNKYYVDELYDAAVVQPIKRVSTVGLWHGMDAGVIDGAVNGTATVIRGSSSVLRRLQSGSLRTYAASLFFGVVVILAYYLWR